MDPNELAKLEESQEMARQSLQSRFKRFSTQIDKITDAELNRILKTKINDAYEHTFIRDIHITSDERDRWNKAYNIVKSTGIEDKIGLATELSDGLMSKEDKLKLNRLKFGGSYTHPKSPVIPGVYNKVTVDEYGHVVFGIDQKVVDTAKNALMLGGINAEFYISRNNPDMVNTQLKLPGHGVEDINNITDEGRKREAVTVGDIQANTISKIIDGNIRVIGNMPMFKENIDGPKTKFLRRRTIEGQSDNWLYFYDNIKREWIPVSGNTIGGLLDSNKKIFETYLPKGLDKITDATGKINNSSLHFDPSILFSLLDSNNKIKKDALPNDLSWVFKDTANGGYMKHTGTGFMLQWGRITEGQQTFGMPFSSLCFIMCTPRVSEADHAHHVNIGVPYIISYSNTGFTVGYSEDTSLYPGGFWLAGGKG